MFTFRPRSPLDFGRTLDRYRLWGVDPANVYRDGAFHRVARVGGRAVAFRLEAVGSASRPRLRVVFAGPDQPETRAALRYEIGLLLGLHSDLAGFYAHARRDAVLAPLVASLYGLRPIVVSDPFEMLVGTIIAQQVNLAFAFTVRAALVRHFGEPYAVEGVTVHAFPSPAVLAGVEPAVLRALQLTWRKAEFVVGLARLVAEGQLDLPGLRALPDEAVIARLTAVRGLGRWTAEWFLARALGRPDVCPADDLGVRRAFEALCFSGRSVDAARIRRRATVWRPFRTLAVHYLLAGARERRGTARPRLTAGRGA